VLFVFDLQAHGSFISDLVFDPVREWYQNQSKSVWKNQTNCTFAA